MKSSNFISHHPHDVLLVALEDLIHRLVLAANLVSEECYDLDQLLPVDGGGVPYVGEGRGGGIVLSTRSPVCW